MDILRGDRGKVAIHAPAILLSLKPVQLLLTPEVAAVTISLPDRRAGDNARIIAVGSIT